MRPDADGVPFSDTLDAVVITAPFELVRLGLRHCMRVGREPLSVWIRWASRGTDGHGVPCRTSPRLPVIVREYTISLIVALYVLRVYNILLSMCKDRTSENE